MLWWVDVVSLFEDGALSISYQKYQPYTIPRISVKYCTNKTLVIFMEQCKITCLATKIDGLIMSRNPDVSPKSSGPAADLDYRLLAEHSS